jgi:translation initiation factor 1
MREPRSRVPTSGGHNLVANNPFAALSGAGLPAAPPPSTQPGAQPRPGGRDARPPHAGHRIDMRRVTGGRGGKTVTELANLHVLGAAVIGGLLKDLKQHCATGGTVQGATIELQGDQRDKVEPWLRQRGFKVVRCGG